MRSHYTCIYGLKEIHAALYLLSNKLIVTFFVMYEGGDILQSWSNRYTYLSNTFNIVENEIAPVVYRREEPVNKIDNEIHSGCVSNSRICQVHVLDLFWRTFRGQEKKGK
jgi:hypothetical protein